MLSSSMRNQSAGSFSLGNYPPPNHTTPVSKSAGYVIMLYLVWRACDRQHVTDTRMLVYPKILAPNFSSLNMSIYPSRCWISKVAREGDMARW
jgi:hypothetical protein